LCIEGDLGEITIDNWRKGENISIGIIKDWVTGHISNNVQILAEMSVILNVSKRKRKDIGVLG
jgi:hypothetical protein